MNHAPNIWTLKGDQIREPIQYLGCGLDNIWLASGYDLETIDGEPCITVRDLDEASPGNRPISGKAKEAPYRQRNPVFAPANGLNAV